MARITLSKEAAMKAIKYTEDARGKLIHNVSYMNNNVNSRFAGLQDPTYEKYYALSMEMQGLLKQIGGKMDDISVYCKKVIRWIDEYNQK